MNIVPKVKNEETKPQEVISFAIASNCLSGPEACIKHVLTELVKAGHSCRIFTENDVNPQWVIELFEFLPKVGYNGQIHTRLEVADGKTDMFLDERNYGGFAGWYAFYGSLISGPVIATTQRNLNLAKDYSFWVKGKEGLNLDGLVIPKIILPGQGN
jgi:hypothetical protein